MSRCAVFSMLLQTPLTQFVGGAGDAPMRPAPLRPTLIGMLRGRSSGRCGSPGGPRREKQTSQNVSDVSDIFPENLCITQITRRLLGPALQARAQLAALTLHPPCCYCSQSAQRDDGVHRQDRQLDTCLAGDSQCCLPPSCARLQYAGRPLCTLGLSACSRSLSTHRMCLPTLPLSLCSPL